MKKNYLFAFFLLFLITKTFCQPTVDCGKLNEDRCAVIARFKKESSELIDAFNKEMAAIRAKLDENRTMLKKDIEDCNGGEGCIERAHETWDKDIAKGVKDSTNAKNGFDLDLGALKGEATSEDNALIAKIHMGKCEVTVCKSQQQRQDNIESLSQVLHIYPNPSDGNFSIDSGPNDIEGEAHLIVYSIVGRVVYNQIVGVNEGLNIYHVNLPDLVSGIYILQIQNGDQIRQTKFMIEK